MISKKLLPILLVCLVPLVFGCSAKSRSVADKINVSVVLSGSELTFGDTVTATMPYSGEDFIVQELLMGKALEGTNYDFVAFPKYKIFIPVIGDSTITLSGRGANVKK